MDGWFVRAGDNSGGGGGGMMVKDDPRYSQYFTMLRLRVPVAAIKQKMMLEGINPDILEYALFLFLLPFSPICACPQELEEN